ncbi:MAG: helicase-related protein [Thiotrichales bacterium]|nr:helicase-related protein [Thiotrichales bacterium]
MDHAPGGYQIVCDGVSELVRGREAVFLTALEPTIQVLDPAETELVPDDSAQFTDSILYMESQLRQAVPNDTDIHVGHTAAMDCVDYQLDPARQALARPRQRILIADAVGLGKTLEAGVLVSELIARGRGRRILVLAVKSMLTQFQKEFWSRFTIPLTRLDSIGIQRVRSRIPTNHNPFYYYDKAIISIDTLKQDAEYRTYLEQASWDIIVIDEAHNVADRGTASRRNRLARLLARRSDTLIMLSATPHDGKARSFASLVNMLDATAITNPDDYTKEDFRPGLVIRRLKKDVQEQVRDVFRDRQVFPQEFPASAAEEAAYDALLAVRIAGRRPETPTRDLFAVTLEKALFSSPAACVETVDERIRRREREISNGVDASSRRIEIASLTALRDSLVRIGPSDYSKYQALLDAIQGGQPFNWRPTETTDRLVIFTERIATLNWLNDRLATDLMLKPGQVETLHGGMSDVEQQRVVEDFGNTQRPVRLLLCSDVASEGINLHYQCHRLIHFDMPWSLMVFQQRNGRVDRYGQTATPQIVYLVTESANPTIRGDTRILEVLMAKDEQAYRNIGDPSVFMDVHDIDEEEEITRKAVARGESDTDFDQRWTPKTNEGESLLAMFLQPEGDNGERPPAATPPPPLSLFPSELDYCAAALHRLQAAGAENGSAGGASVGASRLRFAADAESETLTLDAPEDLVTRYSYLPPEVLPDSRRFVLTTSRLRMSEAIAESRREESTWPSVHYLWRLSPVVGWLNDRVLAAFGRSEAPILSGVPGLGSPGSISIATRARTTESRSWSMRVSTTPAARPGTRRPCSHSCMARTSRPKPSANFRRLNFKRLRKATIRSAVAASIIRLGSATSPRTWARVSPSAVSISCPTPVRSSVIVPLSPDRCHQPPQRLGVRCCREIVAVRLRIGRQQVVSR